ncbi:uncharacterized protein [Dermacentor andersoni]|uniref:uncharacterized protein n=1 Tax=Dermacentor andersoni TaxID=34620 RepID=UPI002415A978|nr:uncharacterized protein LOC129385479 [Dermacentor andersoni]
MELVNEASNTIYGNKDVVVGLSLEMGALMYSFETAQHTALTGAPLYKKCKAASLVPVDMGCVSGSKSHVKDTNIALGKKTQKVVLFFDDDVTVAEKMKYVLGKKPRKLFAWLYFNVHMADFLGRCKMRQPFAPILVLRKNFSIGDKP